MTRTDTFGQLLDRIIVSRLKEHRHREAFRDADAVACQVEASRLLAAMDELVRALASGEEEPRVKVHARYHDHMLVEGDQWAPPATVGRCVNELVDSHCAYWNHQTQINRLKGAESTPAHDSEFVIRQRQCDLMNQRRNVLIQRIDELVAEALRRGPAPDGTL